MQKVGLDGLFTKSSDLKNHYMRLAVLCGVVVLVDQVTKQIILSVFALNESLEVIPGFFALTHVHNTGGAFGLFAGKASSIRTAFFLAVSCLSLGVIFYLYTTIARGKLWVAAAFSLIFAGALGNLIDRIRFGEVVDFLDFYTGTTHWPAFNVADSAICVGVGILLLNVVLKKI